MDVIKRKLIDAWAVITLSNSDLDKEISEIMEDTNVPLGLRREVEMKVAERTIKILEIDIDG